MVLSCSWFDYVLLTVRGTLSPAPQRAYPCEQLGDGEGLHHVVVSAAVETLHAILHVGARRQHQHRCLDARGAHSSADFEAVEFRQHHVKDHDVVIAVLRRRQRRWAVDRHLDAVRLFLEHAAYRTARRRSSSATRIFIGSPRVTIVLDCGKKYIGSMLGIANNWQLRQARGHHRAAAPPASSRYAGRATHPMR